MKKTPVCTQSGEAGKPPPGARMDDVQARLLRKPCLLCGTGKAPFIGLFFPTAPEAWGGVRGKKRLIAYRLCRHCKAVPDRNTKVEARIQAHLGARRN